jgi:Leucine-rich repeat (LRR) protein
MAIVGRLSAGYHGVSWRLRNVPGAHGRFQGLACERFREILHLDVMRPRWTARDRFRDTTGSVTLAALAFSALVSCERTPLLTSMPQSSPPDAAVDQANRARDADVDRASPDAAVDQSVRVRDAGADHASFDSVPVRSDASPDVRARPNDALEVGLPSLCQSATLIDDMEDGTGRICAGAGRTGAWYAFNDGLGKQVPALTGPGVPITPDEIPGGRGGSTRAMHTYGAGFTGWGAGIGLDLAYDGTVYAAYDAGAYDGITFWARADSPAFAVTLRIGTSATTRNLYGGTCTQDPCFPGTLSFRPGAQWTQYWIPFATLAASLAPGASFEPDKLTNIQFLVLGGDAFDFWIDDLSFFAGEAGCCSSLPSTCRNGIRFSDAALDGAVRTATGRPSGALTCADACALYALDVPVSSSSLSSLAGLECLADLTEISVLGSKVTDLTPLANLRLLRKLTLSQGQLRDVRPLSGLDQLTMLDLSANAIVDSSPLSGLGSLTYLTLAQNQIEDCSGLAALANLTSLDLRNNRISSIEPLADLASVRQLYLSDNALADASPLASLTGLLVLNLARNRIARAQPFAGLVNLLSLDLSSNQLTRLDTLLDNPGLGQGDYLWLYGNPVTCDADTLAVLAGLRARDVNVDLSTSQGLPPLCQ